MPTLVEKIVDTIWTTTNWGSDHEALSFRFGMESHEVVAEQERLERVEGPRERDKMEAQTGIPQLRCAVGYPDLEVGGRREGTGYSLWHKARLVRRT